MPNPLLFVIPAHAGIQADGNGRRRKCGIRYGWQVSLGSRFSHRLWIPACAGMTAIPILQAFSIDPQGRSESQVLVSLE